MYELVKWMRPIFHTCFMRYMSGNIQHTPQQLLRKRHMLSNGGHMVYALRVIQRTIFLAVLAKVLLSIFKWQMVQYLRRRASKRANWICWAQHGGNFIGCSLALMSEFRTAAQKWWHELRWTCGIALPENALCDTNLAHTKGVTDTHRVGAQLKLDFR